MNLYGFSEGEAPRSDNKEWLYNSKISQNFSYFFEFQKIVQNFDQMLSEGNFESQFETLNALWKFECQYKETKQTSLNFIKLLKQNVKD